MRPPDDNIANTDDIDRQLQRIAITLRQIADGVERMPPARFVDAFLLVHPSAVCGPHACYLHPLRR
jgi:hypothetical protein